MPLGPVIWRSYWYNLRRKWTAHSAALRHSVIFQASFNLAFTCVLFPAKTRSASLGSCWLRMQTVLSSQQLLGPGTTCLAQVGEGWAGGHIKGSVLTIRKINLSLVYLPSFQAGPWKPQCPRKTILPSNKWTFVFISHLFQELHEADINSMAKCVSIFSDLQKANLPRESKWIITSPKHTYRHKHGSPDRPRTYQCGSFLNQWLRKFM